MATQLKPAQITALKNVGVTGVKTEEDARKKLLKYLAENEVDGVETDPLADLINMAEAFFDGDSVSSDEEDLDELAEEVGGDDEEEEASSDDDEEEEEEEIADDDEEEEEDEPVKPAKQNNAAASKKTGTAPAKKPATETKKPVAETKKPAPAAVKKSPNTSGSTLFDARNNESHDALLNTFREIFPEDEYELKLLKQGFTIRIKGDNAQPTIMNFDEIRILEDETLRGNLYCNRLKNVEELEGFLPEELTEEVEVPKGKGVEYVAKYQRGMFRGETHPSIKGVTEEQVQEILGVSLDKKKKTWTISADGYLAEAINRAKTTDKKMGQNRESMEEKLSKNNAKPATKTTTKKK